MNFNSSNIEMRFISSPIDFYPFITVFDPATFAGFKIIIDFF